MTKESRVVVFIEWAGFNEEKYEDAKKQVNLEGDIPKGLVSHIVAFDKNGIRVTDIWESVEDFNNYIQDRLIPVAGKIGKGEPKVEICPLYTIFIPVRRIKRTIDP